ncbi:MAG: DUF916 domain-containing protein [Patescibacteria group bacterium]
MIRQHQKTLLTLMILALTIGLWPNAGLALSAGGVGISPSKNSPQARIKGSWFVYEVDPGTTIEDAVTLINNSSDEMKVNLEGLDALSTTDGAFALTDNESKNKDIGKWITLTEKNITMPPNSEKDIPFTIAVPADADVGDHIGGITIQKDTTTPDSTISAGGATVGITTRVGVRMYLTVKGDIIRDLQLKAKYWFGRGAKMVFRFKWVNNGNVRANLIANGKIYGLFGLYDQVDAMELGQIFPKKTLINDIAWPGKNRPLFGPYLAILNIQDNFEGLNPNNKITSPTKPIRVWLVTFFIPYTQAIVFVILLFLFWFGWQIRKWLQFIRLAKTPVITHHIKTTDTLQKIAANYGVAWKLLAQINEIKPPYDLGAIKTIYVPDQHQGHRRQLPIPNILVYLFAPVLRIFSRKPHYPSLREARHSLLATAGHPELDSGSRPKSRLGGRRRIELEPVIIEMGDKIKDVAEFAGVMPKEIIRINKLSWPYKLYAGQELLIPLLEEEFKKTIKRVKPKPRVIKKSKGKSRLATKKSSKRRPPKRSK